MSSNESTRGLVYEIRLRLPLDVAFKLALSSSLPLLSVDSVDSFFTWHQRGHNNCSKTIKFIRPQGNELFSLTEKNSIGWEHKSRSICKLNQGLRVSRNEPHLTTIWSIVPSSLKLSVKHVLPWWHKCHVDFHSSRNPYSLKPGATGTSDEKVSLKSLAILL